MDISRITTILDKPKHDQVAWQRSMQLRQQSGAAVEAVSFVWNAMCEDAAAFSADDRRKLRHGIIDERKQWLNGLVAKAPAGSGKVRGRPIYGNDIAAWVADEFSKKCPDLLVKTVHKSGSLVHTPTDWSLLKTCPAPVLLTSKRRRKPSGRVVASIDLRRMDATHRRLNVKVLEAAHCFAELYGNAEMHVVFAVEISRVLRDLDVINERASKQKIVEKVKPELDRLLRPYHIPMSRVHLPVGKVGKVVAQVARKVNADVLVIGSFAHRAKQFVGLGNSAERIIMKSTCDVLAVHP